MVTPDQALAGDGDTVTFRVTGRLDRRAFPIVPGFAESMVGRSGDIAGKCQKHT